MSNTSPIFRLSTATFSIGNAPESSIVLKKIGAMLLPSTRPPPRLFGTLGMSSPISHSTELVADLRLEPVPTTSPTYASGWPFSFSSSISFIGPRTPSSSAVMPSREFLCMANECNGISGRLHASCAGDKSSVLVSPVTLNVV